MAKAAHIYNSSSKTRIFICFFFVYQEEKNNCYLYKKNYFNPIKVISYIEYNNFWNVQTISFVSDAVLDFYVQICVFF